MKSLSCVQLFATPWGVAYQAPPFMGFSRQECRSGLPFPSPGDLPNPGIKSRSAALQADALLSEPPGNSSLRMRGDISLYLNLDFPDGCVPNDLYFRDDSEHHFIYHWLFVCLIWYYLYVFSNGHLYMPILKSSYLFWGFGVFLLLSYISSLYILNINPLSNVICKYFLPFSRLPSHVVDYFLCHVEAC